MFPLALKIMVLRTFMCLPPFCFITYIKQFQNYDTSITSNEAALGEVYNLLAVLYTLRVHPLNVWSQNSVLLFG